MDSSLRNTCWNAAKLLTSRLVSLGPDVNGFCSKISITAALQKTNSNLLVMASTNQFGFGSHMVMQSPDNFDFSRMCQKSGCLINKQCIRGPSCLNKCDWCQLRLTEQSQHTWVLSVKLRITESPHFMIVLTGPWPHTSTAQDVWLLECHNSGTAQMHGRTCWQPTR